MNKRLVPRLRFKGFKDEWNTNKLGDLAGIIRGASPRPISNPKWFDNNSNIGWLRISDVTSQHGKVKYIKQRISKLGESKTRVLTTPHLLLSIAATVGEPVINYTKTGVHDGFIIFKSPKFNKEYMFQWLIYFKNDWQQYGQSGSQVNLNSSIVSNQKVKIPSLSEQNKINYFFSKLDRMIELQSKKVTHLKQLKKAYLQKMFPQKGKNAPKLRFGGFRDSWNIKLLQELIKESNLKLSVNPNKHKLLSVKLHFNGVYPTKKHPKVTKKGRKYYYRNPGELIIGKQNFQNGGFGIAKNNVKGLIASSAILSFDFLNNTNSKFLVNSMMRHDWLQRTTIYLNGTGQKEYGINTLKNLKISIPSSKEQNKIGQFFKHLDQSIAQQGNKLTQLKQLKKAYLQKMFC